MHMRRGKIRSRYSSSARHKSTETSQSGNERVDGRNKRTNKTNEGNPQATNACGETIDNGTISSELGEKVDTRLNARRRKAQVRAEDGG